MTHSVSVTLNSAGNIIVTPDPLQCRANDYLTWTPPSNAELTVNFSGAPPFTGPPPYVSPTVGGSITVQVKPSPTLGSYKYSVTLRVGGKIHGPLDPIVIIANGLMKDGGDDQKKTLIEASSKAEELLQQALERVTKAAESAEQIKFFPDGIDYISVDIEAAPVKVMLIVSGPKSKST